MTKDNSLPAFPSNREGQFNSSGMTKRELYALHAMHGIISATPNQTFAAELVAVDAFKMADAMLLESAK